MSNQTKTIAISIITLPYMHLSFIMIWVKNNPLPSRDCSYFNIIFEVSKVESVFSKNSTSESLTPLEPLNGPALTGFGLNGPDQKSPSLNGPGKL